jgi:predicted amidophosphoribosyltransferase
MFLKRLIYCILDLIFPPLCIACYSKKQNRQSFLCDHCSLLLSINGKENNPHVFNDITCGVTFDNNCHVAKAVLKEIKFDTLPVLVDGLAALMIMEYFELKTHAPDVISIIGCGKRNDFLEFIGKSIAKQLNRKYLKIFKKVSFKKLKINDKNILFICDVLEDNIESFSKMEILKKENNIFVLSIFKN